MLKEGERLSCGGIDCEVLSHIYGKFRSTSTGYASHSFVYRVKDLVEDRLAVLKIRNPQSGAVVSRFQAEIRGQALLAKFPHFLEFFAEGEVSGQPAMLLEYFEGSPLLGRSASCLEAYYIAKKLLRALDIMHLQNMIHRDLKPGNVMMDGMVYKDYLGRIVNGLRLKLLDFGIFRQLNNEATAEPDGASLGTPHFLSPEALQRETENVDYAPRDLFGLGVILFKLLFRRFPYAEGATRSGPIISRMIRDDLDMPYTTHEGEDVPLALIEFLRCLLEKDPEDRYPSAYAAEQALDAINPEDLAVTSSLISLSPSGQARLCAGSSR
jgi:serine/threonine protein kinase